ncbi:unnamed protein product [Lactuca virosa]|uniref:Uncharacterized protein n=1 Tax=Lactuca virosa TaxID=75947 RepID=A0AAU9MNF4_9ASTR|nr:unnamed protein product [Lactuca virosa]
MKWRRRLRTGKELGLFFEKMNSLWSTKVSTCRIDFVVMEGVLEMAVCRDAEELSIESFENADEENNFRGSIFICIMTR